MVNYVDFMLSFAGFLIGIATLISIRGSMKKFSEGTLKVLSSAFLVTTMTGVVYALWNLVVSLDLIQISNAFVTDLPGKILVMIFFVSMFRNSAVIHEMAEMFGFEGKNPKKKK